MKTLAQQVFSATSLLFGARLLYQIAILSIFGIESYGIFAFYLTVATICEKLKNLQVWQIISPYLGGIHKETVLKISFIAEAGFSITAVILCYFSGLISHVENETFFIITTLLLFNFIGTAQSYLRYNNLYHHVRNSAFFFFLFICILSITTYAGLFDISYEVFVSLIILLEIFYFVSVNFAFLVISKIHKIKLCPKKTFVLLNRIRKGLVLTYPSNILRMLMRDGDVFLVGIFLGNVSVGVYRMAKNIAHLPLFVSDGFYFAIHPEFLKKLKSNKINEVKTLVLKCLKFSILGASVYSIILFLFIGSLSYFDLQDKSWYLIASLVGYFHGAIFISLITFWLAPLTLALENYEGFFRAHLISTFIYFVLFAFGLDAFGLSGLCVLLFIYYVLWSLICLREVKRSWASLQYSV